MNTTTRSLILISAIAAQLTPLPALPPDLSPPSAMTREVARDGTLLVSDDLRQADFGGGLSLPVRWVYRSSDQSSNSYGWSGFSLTILEAKAVKKTASLIEVTMLCGKTEFFAPGTGEQNEVWKSNDTQWTLVEDGNKITVTSWDGWELEYRNGLIYRLKTEDNRTLRWDYDSTDPKLVTRIYEPSTNITALTVGVSANAADMYGSSSLRGAKTLTINGDTYTMKFGNGTLKDIEFPDGRKTQWHFESVGPNKRLTLTQESGWWKSWVFGATDRFVKTDDIWSYAVTQRDPGADGVVYDRPDVLTTRLATGETEKVSYSANNSVRESKDVLGNITSAYSYKTPGKLYDKPFKTERKLVGQTTPTTTWRGVYDAATGQLLSSFDALDNQTTFTTELFPNASVFQPPKKTSITDPMGRTRSIERDLQGNIIETIGADGVIRKMEYDARRRLTRIKNAANQTLTRFVYGDQDQILERYDANNQKTSYEYVLHLGEPLLTKVTTPAGRITELTRDSKGRMTKVKSPTGAEWHYTYVADWSVTEKITDPLAGETTFAYDARLNTIQTTDPLARITQTVYDDLDLPSEITDALSNKTKFENNGNRDMKKLTDARNNAYNMAWQGDAERKSLTWPDATAQTNIYDANGALSQWKAKGNAGVINFTRNAAGEISGTTWTSANETGSRSYTRNAAGQITGTSATAGTLSIDQALTYNAEGQATSLAQTYGNITRNAAISYDVLGRIATITYPAGFMVSYEYNADGQITVIKKDNQPLATYIYDNGGRLTARTLSNGVTTTFAYDVANRLVALTVASTTATLWAERYGYNAAGERTFTLQGTTGTLGDAYWLDATSQLRGVKYASPNANATFTSQNATSSAEWQYDAVGNRIAELGTSGNTTYTTNAINQYTGVSTIPAMAYSARGDLTQMGDWAYTYDAQGNLIRAFNATTNTTATYWRDASGHRTVKDVNGSKTLFLNLGTTQLEKYDLTAASASSTIYEPGIDRPLIEIASNGTATFYQQDWLGNVVLLTSTTGSTVESYTYDVWGKVTAKNSTNEVVSTPLSRFLFTAREYDVETSFYHYRARAYSPAIGRFLQIDPIDFNGGDVNLLRYVANDSVNLIDPTGEFAIVLAPAIPWLGSAAISGLGVLGAWELWDRLMNKNQGKEECPAADAPGKPGEEEGFKPPKRGPGSKGEKVKNPNGPGKGYVDDKGDVWVPTGPGPRAHGGAHWDVQTPGGGYRNVYPGGNVR